MRRVRSEEGRGAVPCCAAVQGRGDLRAAEELAEALLAMQEGAVGACQMQTTKLRWRRARTGRGLGGSSGKRERSGTSFRATLFTLPTSDLAGACTAWLRTAGKKGRPQLCVGGPCQASRRRRRDGHKYVWAALARPLVVGGGAAADPARLFACQKIPDGVPWSTGLTRAAEAGSARRAGGVGSGEAAAGALRQQAGSGDSLHYG